MHSKCSRAVALLHTGIISLVFQTEAVKVQVGLALIFRELHTVLLPGQFCLRGALNNPQRALYLIWIPDECLLLFKPTLVHTSLTCK